MSMLHIVNKSPFERNALASCLQHTIAGDAILLIEDAVVGAVDGSIMSQKMATALDTLSVCVLLEDLAARGIPPDRLIQGIKVVDYAGFVDLTVENDKTQSWL